MNTMGIATAGCLALTFQVLSTCTGCGPMDPPQDWERYNPATQTGPDGRITFLTLNYRAWDKVHYSFPPVIRIRDDDGRIWEIHIRGNEPRDWEVFSWKGQELHKPVPLQRQLNLSVWGHPDPPWEYPDDQTKDKK